MAASDPESLPAAFFRRAAERPEEPWLFVREGWDWRWSSFAEVARRVAFWAGWLAASFPPGARLAFPDLPLPRAVVLDLAIQAAGATAVPIPHSADLPSTLPALSVEAWLGDAPPGPFPIPAVALPEPFSAGGPRPDGSGRGSGRGPGRPAGAVLLLDGGAPRQASPSDLLTFARHLEAGLAVPSRPRREIAVLTPPLSAEPWRRLLAWATAGGAVLVLEPEPAALAATAAWARPTVFLGSAVSIAALARALPVEGRLSRLLVPRSRKPSLPLGRLHTILVAGPPGELGGAGLAPDAASFWTSRGVRLAPFPRAG